MAIRTYCRARCSGMPLVFSTLIASALALSASIANAAVVVDGTRVVYPSNRREVSVNLHNVGTMPALVEVWIDAGNDRSKPDDASAPIVATPPLFRMNATQGQTLRLIYTQAPLPSDRETVFWLNVLDIPPRAQADPNAPNHLEMAFRHRLKIFFRPVALRGDPADAAKAVTWSIANGADGPALVAHNPTPYYVSFISADVAAGAIHDEAHTEMVAPLSTSRFALSRKDLAGAGPAAIHYSFVNDFGAVTTGESTAAVTP